MDNGVAIIKTNLHKNKQRQVIKYLLTQVKIVKSIGLFDTIYYSAATLIF